jgi:hypothetical protein
MDALHTVHVSLSRRGAESGHCHDSGGDIEASDLNDPLKSSNQGLIYLDASMSSRSDVSSSGWSPLARGEDAFLGVCPKIRLKFSVIFSMYLMGVTDVHSCPGRSHNLNEKWLVLIP